MTDLTQSRQDGMLAGPRDPQPAVPEFDWKSRTVRAEFEVDRLRGEIEAKDAEIERLRKRSRNQRKELRRLNKAIAALWCGFRRGLQLEGETRLRGIMNAAFGHEQVRKAEHAAVDRRKDGDIANGGADAQGAA